MKAGCVALLGRPNAGKSTLLNRIVGEKVAIVSNKPQTTRTRIIGVKNYDGEGQVVFVDTPGVHKPMHRMNRRMVDVALESMREVEVVALLVDVSVKPGPGDRYMLDVVKDLTVPVILVPVPISTVPMDVSEPEPATTTEPTSSDTNPRGDAEQS